MASKSIAPVPAALAALFISGCGTFLNFYSGHPEPYGGIKKDIEIAATRRQTNNVACNPSDHGSMGLIVFWLADLSCSGVADTVTLPFLLYHEHRLYVDEPFIPPYTPQFGVGAYVPVADTSQQRSPETLWLPPGTLSILPGQNHDDSVLAPEHQEDDNQPAIPWLRVLTDPCTSR